MSDPAAIQTASTTSPAPSDSAQPDTVAQTAQASAPTSEDAGSSASRAAPSGGKPANKARGRKGPEVVVLKTSRVMGPSGRSIARRTVVGCSPERGAALVARGWADPAPKGAVAVLTLTD